MCEPTPLEAHLTCGSRPRGAAPAEFPGNLALSFSPEDMSWSKKLTKKSRNSPKHPTSLGTPSHIGPIPPIASAELEREVGSEGAL